MADLSPAAPPPRPAAAAPPPAALTLVLLIAGAVTLWRLAELFAAPINLSFDEAQYWAWGKDLAWGYFSKPPMVAWVIALTTAVGGDAEPWVRLGAALSHFGAAIGVFLAGRALVSERLGLWGAAVYVTLPGVAVSSMVITTDAMLLLFWALALHAFVRATQTDRAAWWGLLGLWIGLGLLSKYAMAFFVVSMVLALAWDGALRPLLRRPGPWLATALGGLLYAPNLWWNGAHGFASYRHTGENANLSAGDLFHPAETAAFLGSQFGVFGPLLFGALLVLLIVRPRLLAADRRLRLLAAFVLPVLAVMTAQSVLSRANANWAATAYVAAPLLVSLWLIERGRWRHLLTASIVLHLAAAGALYHQRALMDLLGIGAKAEWDLQKRLRGWDEAGAWTRDLAAAHPGLTPLFIDRKVMASMLYYARPEAWDAVMWNPMSEITGQVLNHYELTTTMAGREGDDFLLVTEGDASYVAPWFDHVETLAILRRPVNATYTLTLRAYRLEHFRGYANAKADPS
jgi:4-amino-4-deoxy-L-arabinose transferase-like glycosyltransferase